MFSYQMNKSHGLYVGVYSGDAIADADYERCITSMQELDAAAAQQPQGLLAVLVTDPGTPGVPPAWRKRMADFNRGVKSRPYFLALVTTSMVLRGALTMINWLSPPRPGQALTAHATFDEACRWAESMRGQPLPRLPDLMTAVRRQAA
jgi:hypothetical protein